MALDRQRQFELIANIRAYAKQILDLDPNDIRPSTAYHSYRKAIVRMNELQTQLDCAE